MSVEFEFKNNPLKRIDLEVLAAAFQQKLGNDFAIYTDANLKPEDDKTVGVLKASRIPFGISGVNAETLEISLAFDVNILNEEKKTRILSKLKTLIGWVGFTATVTETVNGTETSRKYKVECFLDAKQTGDPRPDTGTIMLIYPIGGTALITEITNDEGAVIGNDVKVYFENERLNIVSYSSALQKSSRTIINLSTDAHRAETFEIAKSNTYNVSFIYTGNEKETILRKAADLGSDIDAPINQLYRLDITYPNEGIFSVRVKLQAASVVCQIGAFLLLQATFIRDDTEQEV